MKKNNSVIYLIITGVCLVIMVLAIAFILKYYKNASEKEAMYESLQASMTGLPLPSPAPSAASTAPPVATATPMPELPEDEAIFRTVDFAALQEDTCADIYAWISIPDTRIDYPVLQHPSDDSYYLNYNLDGSKGYPGCIYTEMENNKDFSDFNTVIYGHNMKDGSMFHDLHNYEDEIFLPDHPYVYIYTPDRVLRYRIFAAYSYDDRHLLYSFDYATLEGRSGYLSEIFNIRSMSAVLDDQVEVTSEDRLITLSTCVGNQSEKRYLVQAVLVNDILISDINE